MKRDLVGYGATPPEIVWPNGARLAVSVVVNFEEGAELEGVELEGRVHVEQGEGAGDQAGRGRDVGFAEVHHRGAADVQAQVVEWRRWFHQNPELGNREFNTSKRLAEILRGMGLEPKTGIAHTGLTALIEGGKPGPLVAIRTDIDALPVTEQTGLPFASRAREVAAAHSTPDRPRFVCGRYS